jgi:hypothetical protein
MNLIFIKLAMNAFSEDISHFLLIYKFFIQTSFAIENLVSLNSDLFITNSKYYLNRNFKSNVDFLETNSGNMKRIKFCVLEV